MNWTGGSLRRSKRATQGILQRQKAHFGRARTHIQNVSNAPVFPFYPNYLHDNEASSNHEPPTCGQGSIRHTGRRRKRLRARPQGENCEAPSPTHGCSRAEMPPHSTASVTREDYHRESMQRLARGARNARPETKKNALEDEFETQSLEANRKRLLQKQDWIGMALTKGPQMRFPAGGERDRIGKRRKLNDRNGRNGSVARQKNNAMLIKQAPHLANNSVAGPYMSGALQNDIGNIRIHIGTDALTGPSSTLPGDYVQSQASSEPMLFDNEISSKTLDEVAQLSFLAEQNPSMSVGVSEEIDVLSNRTQSLDKQTKVKQLGDGDEATSLPRFVTARKGRTVWTQVAGCLPKKVCHLGDEIGSGIQVTQHVEGIRRPLQFVIDESELPISAGARPEPQGDIIGRTNHALDAANARSSELGYTGNVGNEHERSIAAKAASRLSPIDDDAPWKSFLAISEDRSSSSTRVGISKHGLSCSPLGPSPTRIIEAELNIGSQHATSGGQTRISSSPCASVSLLPIKGASENILPGDQSRSKSRRANELNGAQLCALDADEKLWRGFVFGNDYDSASEALNDDDNVEGTVRDFAKTPSKLLPSSVVVHSPISSTRFETVSALTSCVSNNVQDAAVRAPHSTSSGSILPVNTSLAARPHATGFVEELDEGVGRQNILLRVEHSGFGEQSVTHASMQNNVSCDIDATSSEFSGHGGSCGGLGRRNSTSNARPSAWLGWVERSELRRQLHRPSIYDIPRSSDDGLDVVDPNALT